VPTLLTNPRLSPELAERIERRLRRGWSMGRLRDPNASPFYRARPASLARILPLVAFVAVVAMYLAVRWYESTSFERRRGALLEEISARRAALGPRSSDVRGAVERRASELAASRSTEDLVTPEISGGELATWLARPAVYLRGRACDLMTPTTLASATTAVKDAFLLCLYAPPPSREPKDVLARVRGVNFGGTRLDELTPRVQRFQEAEQGLAVLSPEFEEKTRRAVDDAVLHALERTFEAAPPEAPIRAAGAELLLVVVDEAEVNHATVELVDLANDRVLLRARRHPDTSRWSAERRALFGAQIEGCELALDVRDLAAATP